MIAFLEVNFMGLDLRLDEIKRIPDSDLEATIRLLKGDILTMIHDAGSGHCGGSLSLIRPLLLYFKEIHQKTNLGPHLSKGHCVPAFYALGYRFGNITLEELAGFRTAEGLSGHADHRVQAVPSGLLGQGAGIVNGMALAERAQRTSHKVYGFFGDGEMDEANIWGSVIEAGQEGLNVCYVIDHNGKNLSGRLHGDFEMKVAALRSFGFTVFRANNNIEELASAYTEIVRQNKENTFPCALIVDGKKGDGIPFMEEEASGWHGSPLLDRKKDCQEQDDQSYQKAMEELRLEPTTFRKTRIGVVGDSKVDAAIKRLKARKYGLKEAPTRKANELLAELGDQYPNLRVLTPDIGKSVCMDAFAKKFPNRFIDVGINETGAIGKAMGLAAKGYLPIVSTFDGFTHMLMAHARIADYGQLNLGVVLTHAEFIGEDGPSHLITENLGSWNGLYNIKTIANPADLPQAQQALKYALEQGGLFYLRLGRPDVPTLYTPETLPEPGKAHVLMQGDGPVIITTGQEVWESLIAAEMLRADGIDPTVINVGYFKPFDTETICQAASGRFVVVAEAHKSEVGLAGMVTYQLATNGISFQKFLPIGVTRYVPSDTIQKQKELFGLTGPQIYERVKQELGK